MRKTRVNTAAKRPSLLVVEPHPLALQGLRVILRSFPKTTFHTTVPSEFPSDGPLIVIVDAGTLADPSGELLRSVRRDNPHASVIVLNTQGSSEYLLELLFLGVAGFVAYDHAALQLPEAIRAVAEGTIWMPADTFQQFTEKKALLAGGLRLGLLTRRETTVFGLLERGLCNKEIASSLGVSVSTVKFHLKNIFAKLQVHDRARAVNHAKRRLPTPAPRLAA